MVSKLDRRFSALVEVWRANFSHLFVLQTQCCELHRTAYAFNDLHDWYLIMGGLCLSLQVQACGSMVTEEQPHAMMIPMEYFFMGYGLYRPTQLSESPRSPLSPSCISPELLSPESMGLKLKPIKTRVPHEV